MEPNLIAAYKALAAAKNDQANGLPQAYRDAIGGMMDQIKSGLVAIAQAGAEKAVIAELAK